MYVWIYVSLTLQIKVIDICDFAWFKCMYV